MSELTYEKPPGMLIATFYITFTFMLFSKICFHVMFYQYVNSFKELHTKQESERQGVSVNCCHFVRLHQQHFPLLELQDVASAEQLIWGTARSHGKFPHNGKNRERSA